MTEIGQNTVFMGEWGLDWGDREGSIFKTSYKARMSNISRNEMDIGSVCALRQLLINITFKQYSTRLVFILKKSE